jgi:hypothetical protein
MPSSCAGYSPLSELLKFLHFLLSVLAVTKRTTAASGYLSKKLLKTTESYCLFGSGSYVIALHVGYVVNKIYNPSQNCKLHHHDIAVTIIKQFLESYFKFYKQKICKYDVW